LFEPLAQLNNKMRVHFEIERRGVMSGVGFQKSLYAQRPSLQIAEGSADQGLKMKTPEQASL
jgi:hypothetical protein